MSSFDERILHAVKLLKKSAYVTAFAGAGISTQSGISDFRSPGGLRGGAERLPTLVDNEKTCYHPFLRG